MEAERRRRTSCQSSAMCETAFYPELCYCTTSLHDMLSYRNLLPLKKKKKILFVLVYLKRGKVNDKKK